MDPRPVVEVVGVEEGTRLHEAYNDPCPPRDTRDGAATW